MLSRRIGTLLGSLGILALALAGPGCGCGDDEGVTEILIPEPILQTQIGMDIPPIEVPPEEGPYLIDVMFMIDDSFYVTQETGDPPLGEMVGDGRVKAEVALDIFQDTAEKLKQRLVANIPDSEDSTFDLAFGVSRFEDYARFERSGPRTTNDAQTADPIDGKARPFVLNQPILREDHPRFVTAFQAALDREAPGDGGQDPFDAQSALEALYQLATGAGFDGNGDADTMDSGAPGEIDTMLLQNLPAGINGEESGDVPTITADDFLDDGLVAGQPNYLLGNVEASGNIGGAGWRPDSIRFVVLFSDITTITVIPDDQVETDADGRIIGEITSSPIGPGIAETVKNIQSFASTLGVADLPDPPWAPADQTPRKQQAYARFGSETENPPVAPEGAATLHDVIAALNVMGIEVLSIGIREDVGNGPNKPNQPGVPDAGDERAVPDPIAPPLNKAPFTWMSAVAILTGALAEQTTEIDGRTPSDRGLPLVYNLTTVFPLQEAEPLDHVLEDLSYRVEQWLPFAPGGGGSGDPGWTQYDVTFELNNPNQGVTILTRIPLQPGGDPPYVSGSGTTQRVRIRNYFEDDDAPDPVRVAWEFQSTRTVVGRAAIDTTLTFSLTPQNPNPLIVPPPCEGTIFVELFEIPADATTAADFDPGRSSLTQVLPDQSPAFFRDVTQQTPSGTSIDTMAGPLGPLDVPYPAP